MVGGCYVEVGERRLPIGSLSHRHSALSFSKREGEETPCPPLLILDTMPASPKLHLSHVTDPVQLYIRELPPHPSSITHNPFHRQLYTMNLLPSFQPITRTMASLAFKSTLSVGQRLPGKHWQYKLTQRLPSGWSSNNLFKAEILDDTTGLAPKWYAVSRPSATKLFELTFQLGLPSNQRLHRRKPVS